MSVLILILSLGMIGESPLSHVMTGRGTPLTVQVSVTVSPILAEGLVSSPVLVILGGTGEQNIKSTWKPDTRIQYM